MSCSIVQLSKLNESQVKFFLFVLSIPVRFLDRGSGLRRVWPVAETAGPPRQKIISGDAQKLRTGIVSSFIDPFCLF